MGNMGHWAMARHLMCILIFTPAANHYSSSQVSSHTDLASAAVLSPVERTSSFIPPLSGRRSISDIRISALSRNLVYLGTVRTAEQRTPPRALLTNRVNSNSHSANIQFFRFLISSASSSPCPTPHSGQLHVCCDFDVENDRQPGGLHSSIRYIVYSNIFLHFVKIIKIR